MHSSLGLWNEAVLTMRSEAFRIPTTVIMPLWRARRVLVSASANDRGAYRSGETWCTAARCNHIGGLMRKVVRYAWHQCQHQKSVKVMI